MELGGGKRQDGIWKCGRRSELKAILCSIFILLMFREENSSKRESESMALLQKLIRLDSKDCNFHFKDDLLAVHFKVAYPQTNTDNNSNEGLLRQLWHHVWAHYFKRIEQEELRRLSYVRTLLTPSLTSSSSSLPISAAALLPDLTALLQPRHLTLLLHSISNDHETVLWLKTLYLNSKLLSVGQWLAKQDQKKSKIIYSKLKQSRKHRRILKGKKAIARALQEDQQTVDEFIQELQRVERSHTSEIDDEIAQLEAELKKNSATSLKLLEGLEERIIAETQNESRGSFRNFMTSSSEFTQDNSKDLECLEYLIRCLEEKQIAESIAKILSTQRNSGEILLQVTFQKAINIEPKLMTERELLRLNYLRETSLIQFYRTGVKSPYSYICHNYVGFRELMQNRLAISARLKDKCILQMMKKGACLANIGEIQHQMARFNTCHHCKFLYPDNLLFTCSFTSDKQAIPKLNLEAVSDPNLTEAFQEGPNKSRTSQRFMTRRKNCLTSYAKIHDEYVCGRKYCFSCLKDTYSHQSIRQNGLCPFCLGVCICTRCLRNEKIARFKNMYSLLGGDLTRIQDASELQQLQVRPQEVVQRGRGRPKKYALSHISVNVVQKKLRRLDDEGQGGKKRRNHLYNYWKRNDSGNDTQEENDPKRKKKRGVGRPRLDRKKYAAVQ